MPDSLYSGLNSERMDLCVYLHSIHVCLSVTVVIFHLFVISHFPHMCQKGGLERLVLTLLPRQPVSVQPQCAAHINT